MRQDRALQARIEELERRMSSLESAIATLRGRGLLEPARRVETERGPTTTEPDPAPTVHLEAQPAPEPAPEAAAIDPIFDPIGEAADREREPVSLESIIGGRVFPVLGVLVLVVGVGLFLKLAYDRGWLDLLSPAMKCVSGAGFGAALLIAGEVARRRWTAPSSAALSAAGLGSLYAAGFAAYATYGLVGAGMAFGMLAATAGLGLLVALRAGLRSVGLLSMLAAYLTPALLHDMDSPAGALPGYLLAVAGAALALVSARPAFSVLRPAAWVGTVIYGAFWALARSSEAPIIGIGFVTLVWVMFHGSLMLSATASRSRGERPQARPLLTSLGTSAWAAAVALLTLEQAGSTALWAAPGAGFVMTATLGIVMAGGLRVLRDRPVDAVEALGACLAAQAGAMGIAAVAIGITGDWLQVTAWLAFGLSSVVGGRWIGSRALDIYGLVVLSIGLVRLVLIDGLLGSMWRGGEEALGFVLSEWTLMMAIASACWIAASRLLKRRVGEDADDPAGARIRGWVALVGVGSGLLSVVHPEAMASSMMWAWGLAGAALFAVHVLDRGMRFDVGAGIALIMASAAWGVAFPVLEWARVAGEGEIHRGLLGALGLAAIAGGGAWWLRRCDPSRGVRLALGFGLGALALTLVSTSAEVARLAERATEDGTARGAAVSIWWGLFGVGLLVWGSIARAPERRWIGLGLLGLATVKAVVFDMRGVDPAWRVASFLGLGLLLLVVGTAYLRSRAHGGDGETPGGDPR